MSAEEALDIIRALGTAEPPSDRALAAARETLWSAVAGEMLPGVAGAAAAHRPSETPRPAHRRQPSGRERSRPADGAD